MLSVRDAHQAVVPAASAGVDVYTAVNSTIDSALVFVEIVRDASQVERPAVARG